MAIYLPEHLFAKGKRAFSSDRRFREEERTQIVDALSKRLY